MGTSYLCWLYSIILLLICPPACAVDRISAEPAVVFMEFPTKVYIKVCYEVYIIFCLVEETLKFIVELE